jgi:hypothetical protein
MQRHALVVEDEPVVCQMIGKTLKSAGIEAMTLTRSTEAPEILEAGASFFPYKPIHKNRLLKLVRGTLGSMEQERRRTRRVPIQSNVSLQFGAEELLGETVDVSTGGLLVHASRVLPLGSSLRMRLQLSPRMEPIKAAGSVVRILNGNQMGIQLNRLALLESERLQEFLLHSIPNA